MLSVVYPKDILFLLTLRKDRPYQGTISCVYAHAYILHILLFFLIGIIDLRNILFSQ
nr:MAG TPA: hypothetical protein [Caudoviricetes sp.]